MKLLILNDIFNQPTPENCISTLLTPHKQVDYLTLNHLCEMPDLRGDALHHHLFEQAGIDTVVQALHAYADPETIALGYSAGGTALWWAAQQGMALKALFCVSSTRLRELGAIVPETHVYFGSLDPHRPNEKWLAQTPANHKVFKNVDHSFYAEPTSSANQQARHIIANDIAQYD